MTAGPSHVRDGLDLKRLMMTVVIALAGCVYMAFHNTGYQANLAIARGAAPLDTWQTGAMETLGLGFAPDSLVSCLVPGGLYYLRSLLVTFAVGALWEALFAMVRKHELTEGFPRDRDALPRWCCRRRCRSGRWRSAFRSASSSARRSSAVPG